MKIQLNLTAVFLGLMMGTILASNTKANAFPIATNSTVMEFAGGAVTAGTNYLVGFISGTNLAAQLISPDGQLIGSPQVLGANPGFPPAAAVVGAKTNSLAAWSDTSLGSGVTMFGQILSSTGTPVGAKFPLLASAGSYGPQFVQAAASDGTNFLVVWQASANTNFYGQLVSGTGTLIGPEFPLPVSAHNLNDRDVALTFGKSNYLLAWQTGSNNTNNTDAVLISPTGNVGSSFQLNTTSSMDKNPLAAAFDGTNYLVVWSRDTNYNTAGWPEWNLCGRLVSQSGLALGSEQVLVTENATFPALAFDGANYLLAWGYDTTTTNTDATIHTQFFDRSANVVGPVFTPFSSEGGYPPLLPIDGVLFAGNRYLLTATYATFVLDNSGDVNGLQGGDVYGRFLPPSTQPPVWSGATVKNGLFQGNLNVVPGMFYTIEVSSNLPSWTAVDVVSSADTNVIALNDDRPVSGFSRMFYRVSVGNSLPPSYYFSIHEYANGASFAGGYTPAQTFPVYLSGYAANMEVWSDPAPPVADTVFFTGPAGSGLTNTMADVANSSVNASDAFYQSPTVINPTAAPGGTWQVTYRGTNVTFDVGDPMAASRLVIPLPTVNVNGSGIVQNVSWVYKDANSGATLSSAPTYVKSLQVQIEGYVGGRIYNSPDLDPGITSNTLTNTVNWTNVSSIFMAYDDSYGNQYIVFYNK